MCDGKGKFAVDSYTGRVSDLTDRKPQSMTPEAREGELQRLGTSLTISEGNVDPEESYGWEKARAHQIRSGSYEDLRQALEMLRMHDTKAWDHIVWVYGELPVEMSRHRKAVDELYIGRLSKLMPRKVRIPREHYEAERQRRIDTALEMRKGGATSEEISLEVLVPADRVDELLRKSV